MNDFESIFSTKKKLKWYHILGHLGYYFYFGIKTFFSKPFKEEKKDLRILDIVQTLLETGATDENIEQCKQLTHLHRIVENTRARRRLEKWSLRVIAVYLLVVLGIVIANYIYIPALMVHPVMEIPVPVMITILSTTTVNIIGLGLIVLKGHFLANESSDSIDKAKNKHCKIVIQQEDDENGQE